MSARHLRRSFATPFVVTLASLPAACVVQSGPPANQPTQMQPGQSGQPTQPAQPTPVQDPQPAIGASPQRPAAEQPPAGPTTTVIANPPRPTQPAPKAKDERHWTVMKSSDKCLAYVKVSCPPNAMCNPPPPTAYACTPEVTQAAPLKIVQYVGQDYCQVEREPMNCPPKVMCNPPPPTKIPCPQ